MLKLLKSFFGGGSSISNRKEQEISFDRVDDGQYFARYVDEKSNVGKLILIILEITEGEYKGTKIPMSFDNPIARRVSKEASGEYISRLSYEGVALASKLEDNMNDNENNSFLVRVKDGKVVSVYKYNDEKIYTFMKKLEKDPSFKG